MNLLNFGPSFETFKSFFIRITDTNTRINVQGIVRPYREKYIGLRPEGDIRAPQIKIYVHPDDSLKKNDFVIWKNDKYIVLEPLEYEDHANVNMYIGTLIEEDVE